MIPAPWSLSGSSACSTWLPVLPVLLLLLLSAIVAAALLAACASIPTIRETDSTS